MRIKFSLLAVSLLGIASVACADSLSVGQIAQELKQDAAIPLAPSVGNQLAKNLLDAQTAAWGKVWYPGSLDLSIEAVLKAIGVYSYPNGPTQVTDDHVFFWLVWDQSTIAVDPRLTVTLTPGSLDFGSQPVVTPEPEGWILLLTGLTAFVIGRCAYRYAKQRHFMFSFGHSATPIASERVAS